MPGQHGTLSTVHSVDATLSLVAEAPSVSVELGGCPNLAPLPASRTIDGLANGISSTTDGAAFAADVWSASLPHGFALCERRVQSTYDRDALDFFRELASLEDQYAKGLQRLSERVIKEPDGGQFGGGGGAGATGTDGADGASSSAISSGWRWGGFMGGSSDRPLCRSVQYATTQHAWGAAQQTVRAQAKAHRALASEIESAVVKPLTAATAEAQKRVSRPGGLSAHFAAKNAVVSARRQAAEEARRYGRMLHRYRREARKNEHHGKGFDRGPEAMLLCAAAHDCASRVAEANALTASFEDETQKKAIDALQEHEERRLESVDAALSAFASAAASTGTLPSESVEALKAAAAKVDVPADVCTFAAAYAPSAQRPADLLTPPSFCAALAAGADGTEQAGFWSAPWRLLRNLATSILGDADDAAAPPPRPALTTAFTGDRAAAPGSAAVSLRAACGVVNAQSNVEIVEITSPITGGPLLAASPGPGSRIEDLGSPGALASPDVCIPAPADFVVENLTSPLLSPSRKKRPSRLGALLSPTATFTAPAPPVAAPPPDVFGDSAAASAPPSACAAAPVPPPADAAAANDDDTTAILSAVDEVVATMGGAGLTMAEAVMLQEQVLAEEDDEQEATPTAAAALKDGASQPADGRHTSAGMEGFAEGEWYYQDAESGEPVGPITWSEMREAAGGGGEACVMADSWVFMEGMEEWLPADAVPGLLPAAVEAAAVVANPPSNAPPPAPPAEEEEEESAPLAPLATEVPVSPSRSSRAAKQPVPRGSVTRDSFACFVPKLSPLMDADEDADGKENSPLHPQQSSMQPPPPPEAHYGAGSPPAAPSPAPPRAPTDGVPNALRLSLSAAPGLNSQVSPSTWASAAQVDDPDAVSELLSPHVYRSKRRKQSIKRRSSLGMIAPHLAPLSAADEPLPPGQAPPPPAPPPAEGGEEGDNVSLTLPPPPPPPPLPEGGSSGSHVLLGAIQGFDKGSRLKKVRRQSSLKFANGAGRPSMGGGRKSMGPPPPPPPPSAAGSAAQMNDIASVLARAIMRRRQESMLDEELPSSPSVRRSNDSDGEWATSP